jgi:hypothetical protein
VAGALAFLLAHRDVHPSPPPAAGATPTPTPNPSPTLLPQAKWHMRAFPAGVVGHVTKKDLKAVRTQSVRASHAVENVYDSLLLDPGDVGRVIRAHFERGAARAFLRTRTRLPGRVRHVRTIRRRLQIGIDAKSARKAIATVLISFKAERNSRRVRLHIKSTLWLEHKHSSWKVLAWRAGQGPRR